MQRLRAVKKSPAFWIFLAALVVRILPVLFSFSLGIGLDDMFQYDMLGRSLVAGNGFRWYSEPDLNLIRQYIPIDTSTVDYDPRGIEASYRGLMYPLFLAAVYFFSGLQYRFFAARLVQAMLAALLAPMAYALARRLDPGSERTPKIAGWIVALYPMLALYPLALATENFFFVLTFGSVLLLLRAGETGKLRTYALAGAVAGMAILTRSVISLFIPLAMWWAWRNMRSLRGALVFACMAAAVTFPWALRNSLLAGRPTFVESSMGYNLYMGYHPQSSGTFQFGISLDLLTIFDDTERDTVGTVRAMEFIRADPGRIPTLISNKAGYFFGLERRALTYFYSNNLFGYIPPLALAAIALLFLLPFMLLAPAAAFGAAALPRSHAKTLVLFFLLAYITPHFLIIAEERFHMTIVPFLAAFAPAALIRWREILASLRSFQGWKKMWLPVLITLLLVVNWGFELAGDSASLAVLFGPNGNTAGFPY
jgi:4-amino-4-deoxy-L-arabinose transferase-like glycosyltransferase